MRVQGNHCRTGGLAAPRFGAQAYDNSVLMQLAPVARAQWIWGYPGFQSDEYADLLDRAYRYGRDRVAQDSGSLRRPAG